MVIFKLVATELPRTRRKKERREKANSSRCCLKLYFQQFIYAIRSRVKRCQLNARVWPSRKHVLKLAIESSRVIGYGKQRIIDHEEKMTGERPAIKILGLLLKNCLCGRTFKRILSLARINGEESRKEKLSRREVSFEGQRDT